MDGRKIGLCDGAGKELGYGDIGVSVGKRNKRETGPWPLELELELKSSGYIDVCPAEPGEGKMPEDGSAKSMAISTNKDREIEMEVKFILIPTT